MPVDAVPATASLAQRLLWSSGVVAAAGMACVAYGVAVERRWYRRREYRLDILPPEIPPLSVLHVSDLHYVSRERRKARFLAGLPRPDLLVATGDLLGEPDAVESVTAALRPVRGSLASYLVLGSNDYFAPRPLNPAQYFRSKRKRRPGVPSRTDDLLRALRADGWTCLRNERTRLDVGGASIDVVGLDDPHIERHDLRLAVRDEGDGFGLAIVHSPDPVPELVALGWDLIVTGHTHGGQVRMPFVGALVTNSQFPNRLAMGLSRFGSTYVHVSPGLGTSKYAPFRFLCRPEATILQLGHRHASPRDDPGRRVAASR